MTSGALFTIVLTGDYGQAASWSGCAGRRLRCSAIRHVLPLTSEITAEHLVRITVPPSRQNGLRQASQIMVDKVSTLPRTRIGNRVGRVDAATMRAVDGALAGFLGLN